MERLYSYHMRVTDKGQITIPIDVRRRLGIRPGDEVDIEYSDGVALVRRSERSGTFSQRLRGRARGMKTTGLSTDEIMALTRGD